MATVPGPTARKLLAAFRQASRGGGVDRSAWQVLAAQAEQIAVVSNDDVPRAYALYAAVTNLMSELMVWLWITTG